MNEFAPAVIKNESTIATMLVSRQAQEVQAAMVIAKKFPRDEAQAFDRIMRACERKGLAEQAAYTYPRGTEKITGPSIRLAESLAQNWGNIDYGIIELENAHVQSDMMAYAWDLETNTRVTKVFSVKHKRDTKKGSYDLTDSRDIYEATANFGARRVRACILGVIPGDVIDAAIVRCQETITGAHKTPIADRYRKMVAQFEKEYMVSQAMIEAYIGCNVNGITEGDLLRMAGVYRSLRDGMSEPADFFKEKAKEASIASAAAATALIPQPFKTSAPAAPIATIIDPDAELKEEIRKEHGDWNEWQVSDEVTKRKAAAKQ